MMTVAHLRTCLKVAFAAAIWVGIIISFLFLPSLMRLRSDKELRILIWPMTLDAKVFADFERKTGIKVHLSYFESNEELLHKLSISGGKDYDLIMAVDYLVQLLIEQKYLKKMDVSRLTFFKDINPLLQGHYYDPTNEYAIPYFSSMYGLGIDTKFFQGKSLEPSWKLLFDTGDDYKVVMSDDPRRAIMIADKYLFGRSWKSMTADHVTAAITDLLLKQKPSVEMYSDIRAEDLLASKSCPVTLITSPDFWRLQQEFSDIEFIFPKEGSFIAIDSLVMLASSQNDDLVYTLLNYIYQPEVIERHIAKYGFCSPLTTIDTQQYNLICADDAHMQKVDFFTSNLTQKQINDIWLSVLIR